MEAAEAQRQILSRIDLLFDPFDKGPQAVSIDEDCNIVTTNAQLAASYNLVVVDEAHHIYSNTTHRAAIESHVSGAGSRRLLLSDVSQSLGEKIDYPTGMTTRTVELTEVVRSSQRIVAGANAFRCDAKVGRGSHQSAFTTQLARRSSHSSSTPARRGSSSRTPRALSPRCST